MNKELSRIINVYTANECIVISIKNFKTKCYISHSLSNCVQSYLYLSLLLYVYCLSLPESFILSLFITLFSMTLFAPKNCFWTNLKQLIFQCYQGYVVQEFQENTKILTVVTDNIIDQNHLRNIISTSIFNCRNTFGSIWNDWFCNETIPRL